MLAGPIHRASPTSLYNSLGKFLDLPSLKPKCQVNKKVYSNKLAFGLGKLKTKGPHVLIFLVGPVPGIRNPPVPSQSVARGRSTWPPLRLLASLRMPSLRSRAARPFFLLLLRPFFLQPATMPRKRSRARSQQLEDSSSDDDVLLLSSAAQISSNLLNVRKRRPGGSVPGHRVIYRDREGGHKRMF